MTLASATAPSGAAASEPERFVVGFHHRTDVSPGDRLFGATVVATLPDLALALVETTRPGPFQEAARGDDRVRYVEPDASGHRLLFVPNDPLYGHAAHWGSKRVGAEAGWDVTRGSTAVKVAMVDSGLNRGHQEYAGQARVLQGYDFKDGDADPQDSRGCSWHGTHTTGTAGAAIDNGLGIAGMSQHAILPVKIFGGGFGGCGTTTSAIVGALKYAGDQGAHVSSNSWGGGGASTAINDAIRYAHARGTIHVAAAGNDGPCTSCVGQPWRDNPAITVVVSSLSRGDVFSGFSSEGPQVDIIAPGEYIASSTSGTSDYHAYSGTSMAAPHVAGAIALHLATHPGATFADVEAALAATAESLSFSSDRQGQGLLRADRLAGGGTTPTYACSDGTDNDGDGLVDLADLGCATSTDNDETNAASAGFALSVQGYKVKGVKHGDLVWSGAGSSSVDVYRDGGRVATTVDDGAFTDNTGRNGGGTTTWKVCHAGTSTCSNDASWTF